MHRRTLASLLAMEPRKKFEMRPLGGTTTSPHNREGFFVYPLPGSKPARRWVGGNTIWFVAQTSSPTFCNLQLT